MNIKKMLFSLASSESKAQPKRTQEPVTTRTVQAPSVMRHAKPPYDWLGEFSEGRAFVSDKKKLGYIDPNGDLVIPMSFCGMNSNKDLFFHSTPDFNPYWQPNPWDFHEGLAIVFLGTCAESGVINKDGEFVIQPGKWTITSPFSEGLARIRDNDGKEGFIDAKGRIAIKPGKWDAWLFSEGMAVVYRSDVYGKSRITFLDKSGHTLDERSPFLQNVEILLTRGFSEGYAYVISKKWNSEKEELGFIDNNGSFFTSYGTPHANFHGGLALFCDRNGKYGYINKSMDVVIEPQYDFAGPFQEGKAFVFDFKRQRSGFIDSTGRMLFTKSFDNAGAFSEGMASIMVNNKIGFINAYGEMVIPPQFNDAGAFHNGWATVLKDGAWNFIDKNGLYMF